MAAARIRRCEWTGDVSACVRVLCFSAALLALGCPKPPPQTALADRQLTVNMILADADDHHQLSSLAGGLPEACVEITASTRICQWRLGSRHRGWARLAAAIGTRDQINLLCELPSDASPREPESCGVFPRRSNRTLFRVPNRTRAGSVHRGKQQRVELRARYRRLANDRLDAARTAVELSRLMGAAPDRCDVVDANYRGCVWRASNRTYGHGTLVESIGAEKRQRMRLECRLPANGGPREEGSCWVTVDR